MSRFIHYTFTYYYYSGGLRVIHYYCHLMRELGYDSYITSQGNPDWNTPIFQGNIIENDIVIYPEPPHVYRPTNPLNSRNIVRYFLYFPKQGLGQPYTPFVPTNEYCMPFSEEFFDSCAEICSYPLPKENILCVPNIDPNEFHNRDIKDIENVYYIGKGSEFFPSPYLPSNSIEITYRYPISRMETAKLLRRTKNFYTFDKVTALIAESQLCGCKSFILNKNKIPEPCKPSRIAVMDHEKDLVNVDNAAKRILEFFNK